MSEQLGRAAYEAARAAQQAGQLAQAAQLAAEAEAHFQANGDITRTLQCRILKARCLASTGQVAAAEEAIRSAMDAAQRGGQVGLALSAATDLGALQEQMGHLQEAMATHRAVLDGQRSRGDVLGAAIAAANVGRLLPRCALPNQRSAALTETKALLTDAGRAFMRAGRPAMAAQVLVVMGDQMRAGGELHHARDTFAKACEIAARAGDTAGEATATLNLALAHKDEGKLAQALAGFARSRLLSERAGDHLGALRARLGAAVVEADRLPTADAAAHLHELMDDFASRGHRHAALPARASLATVLARKGELIAAQAQLLEIAHQLELSGERLSHAEVLLALAELDLTRQRHAHAVATVADLLRTELPPRLATRAHLLAARAALLHLDLNAAEAHWQRATTAETTVATQVSIALGRAQVGTWQLQANTPMLLQGLAAACAASARESAAVALAQATDLAWRGDRSAAVEQLQRATGAWRELGEPLALASCAALGLWLDSADHPDEARLLEQIAQVHGQGAVDVALTLEAALAAQRGDVAHVHACARQLLDQGSLAAALSVTHLSRLTLDDLHLAVLEEEIWLRAATEAGGGRGTASLH